MYRHLIVATNVSLIVSYPKTSRCFVHQAKRNNRTSNLLVIRDQITGCYRHIHCPLRFDVSVVSKIANSIARCIQRKSQKLSGGRKS